MAAKKSTKKTAKTASKKRASKGKKSSTSKKSTKKVTASKAKKSAPKVQVKLPKMKNVGKNLQEFATKNSKMLTNLGWFVAGIFALLSVDYLVQYINNDMSVAVVNNSRVAMSEYYDRLEQKAGIEVADELIREKLISQAAREAGIKVTNEEIDAEYENALSLYGGEESFTEALDLYGLTVQSYKDSIKIELLASKVMVTEPTDEQLQEFFDENKDTMFPEQEALEDNKENVVRAYTRAELNTEFPTWIQTRTDESVIQNNVEEKPGYGFFKASRNIFGNMYEQVQDYLKSNESE